MRFDDPLHHTFKAAVKDGVGHRELTQDETKRIDTVLAQSVHVDEIYSAFCEKVTNMAVRLGKLDASAEQLYIPQALRMLDSIAPEEQE